MRVLASAFSCGPRHGSEPGVGWNWSVEIARLGHDVVVLTQPEFRSRIEEDLAAGGLPQGLRFEFLMPGWLDVIRRTGLWLGAPSLTWQTVHLLWQFVALRHARKLAATGSFDVVHHVTLGGIRHPTLLGRLGLPLVIGPLGGGERAPFALRRGYSRRGWWFELLRDAHNAFLKIDPITWLACRDAMIVYAKTKDSKAALPARFADKIRVRSELGIAKVAPPRARADARSGPLRLIYAGNMLDLKGLHLGLPAVAEARRRGADVRLTMVGAGPARPRWEAMARELGIDALVDWRGRLPQAELFETYAEHDALLFPSLRDSSGNVVLEALSYGLPVICLDLGGPPVVADSSCGHIVPAADRTTEDCIAGLAAAIGDLAASPERCQAMSRAAIERAESMLWPKVVAGIYREIEAAVEARAREAAPRAVAGARPT